MNRVVGNQVAIDKCGSGLPMLSEVVLGDAAVKAVRAFSTRRAGGGYTAIDGESGAAIAAEGSVAGFIQLQGHVACCWSV